MLRAEMELILIITKHNIDNYKISNIECTLVCINKTIKNTNMYYKNWKKNMLSNSILEISKLEK